MARITYVQPDGSAQTFDSPLAPVPTANLYPAVLIMEPTQDWTTENVTGGFDGARAIMVRAD